MSKVQSVIFLKRYYSPDRAKEWLRDHGYKYGKLHTTEKYHRFRQFEPTKKKKRTIPFTKTIKAIIEF